MTNNLKKKKKLRCFICLKKIIILAFECKCKQKFCNIHKYPEEHNCTYDHKNEGKRKLNQILDNSAIKRSKIDKI